MSVAAASRKNAVAAPSLKGAPTGNLRIGPADDAFEREADRIADDVMAADSVRWSLSRMSLGAPLQRKCSCGGSCDSCKEDELQRKADSPGGGTGYAPDIVHDVLRSPGSPLDSATRRFFEPRFGHALSVIRIHADVRAAESAKAVHALAYTVGNHVVFGSGRYRPGSGEGRKLLAHELAHTVQQSAGPRLQRSLDPYASYTIAQLRSKARTDTEAAEALRLRFRAMSKVDLERYARNDPMAQAEYSQRNVAPADAEGQGRFSRSGVLDALERDIQQQRVQFEASSGVARRAPSVVDPTITRTEGGTMGSARTDIPGLENRSFLGRSPQAGGQINPDSQFAPPTDPAVLPQTHGHAEQEIADQIEAALRSVPRDQLRGRTVWMLIEQVPCSTCAQGVGTESVAPGVLKKLSQAFPEVTFGVKNIGSSALMVLRNGSPATPVAGAAGGTAAPQTEGGPQGATPVRVGAQIRVLKSIQQADGSTVAEVEYSFADGLEGLNHGAPAGSQIPARLVIRVTQNADGAITAVESMSGQPQALAEALARQTLPEGLAGVGEGAGEGAAAGARGMARLSTGLKIGGWVAFAVITGYQLYKATPQQVPRVMAQAGGGLAGGMIASYAVCNLLLDVETAGGGIFICGLIVGGAGGYAGSEITGDIYDDATRTDLDFALQDLDRRNTNVRNLFTLLVGAGGGLSVDANFVNSYLSIVPADLREYEVILLAGQVTPAIRAAAGPQAQPSSPDAHAGETHLPAQKTPGAGTEGTVCPNCHRSNAEGQPSHLSSADFRALANAPNPKGALLAALRTAVSQLPARQRAPGDIAHHPPAGTPQTAVHPSTGMAAQGIPPVAQQIGTVCPNCHRANEEVRKDPALAGTQFTDADRQAIQNFLNTPAPAQTGNAHATPAGVAPPHATPQGFPSIEEQQGSGCPSGNCHQPAAHDDWKLGGKSEKDKEWFMDPAKWK